MSVAEEKAFASLCYTGERMVPEEAEPDTFWEHIYRYKFALPYVADKKVLDIACGEGYGSHAMLSAGAREVIGVDISDDACRHAQQKYGIDARQGSAEQIPLPAKSVDVVVSFETIEHLENPEALLDECVRVLRPSGVLVISTPNRDAYSANGSNNPYHLHEWNESEFKAALSKRFSSSRFFTQRPKSAAWWSLRSLAADESFWHKFRRVNRLTRELQSRYCPHILGEPGKQVRLSTADTIVSNELQTLSCVDPFAIRQRTLLSRETPLYFIGVAQNPKQLSRAQ